MKWSPKFVSLPILAMLLTPGEIGMRANAQILHGTGDLPSFEVATIKPWKRTVAPPSPDGMPAPVKVKVDPGVSPGGAAPPPSSQLHMILPISVLIASAYNLPVGSGAVL